MAKNRQAAQKFILTYIDKLAPGGANKAIYEEFFKNMSDKDFDEYMQGLKSGDIFLTIVLPNFAGDSVKVSVENNLALARELGHEFFERVWVGATNGMPAHLTPNRYMIVDLPFRRMSQLLIKGVSVPDDNRTVDSITGQPTGESKGAKISHPELQLSVAMGLDNAMKELMKTRGGDLGGLHAFNGMISKYGRASSKALEPYSTGVESTRSLKTFLTSMHLKSNL